MMERDLAVRALRLVAFVALLWCFTSVASFMHFTSQPACTDDTLACMRKTSATILNHTQNMQSSWTPEAGQSSVHSSDTFTLQIAGEQTVTLITHSTGDPRFAVGNTVELTQWGNEYIGMSSSKSTVYVLSWSWEAFWLVAAMCPFIAAFFFCLAAVVRKSTQESPGWLLNATCFLGTLHLLIMAVLLINGPTAYRMTWALLM